jgi:hypothetical protein
LAVISTTRIQRAGGNLIVSKVIFTIISNSHGLEDKDDKLVVDPLLSVKDTLPGSEEVEQHCRLAYDT